MPGTGKVGGPSHETESTSETKGRFRSARSSWFVVLLGGLLLTAHWQGMIQIPGLPSSVVVPSPSDIDGLESVQARQLLQRREAVRQNPKSLETWLDYAYMLDALAMNEEAIEVYEIAMEMDPEDVRPRYGLGYLLRIVGRVDESIAYYNQLITELPGYPPVLVKYGDALDYAGRTEEALGAYEEAVALDPNFAQAHRQLGQALLLLGRVDEAITQLERTRELQDRDRATYLALSRAYQLAGDVEMSEELAVASEDMKSVLSDNDHFRLPTTRLRPKYANARIVAQAALRTQRYSEALDDLLLALVVWPEQRWVHLGLVLAYEAENDLERAEYHRKIADWLRDNPVEELGSFSGGRP